MKKIFLVNLIVIMVLMTGCQLKTNDNNDDFVVKLAISEMSKQEAITIAEEEIRQNISKNITTTWNENSLIADAYPLYIDGITGISYYECKVTTDGVDTGYILVNTNQSDVIIPEMSCEGLTLTEKYTKVLNDKNFKIMRFDWFLSAAYSDTPSKSDGNQLASIGFDKTSEVLLSNNLSNTVKNNLADYIKQYQKHSKNNNCLPLYDNKKVKNYYIEMQNNNIDFESKKSKTISDELNHKFKSGWHTPKWRQFAKSNGYAIGCGPAAWAIVYAYWKQFHGKKKLFDGFDVNNFSYVSGSYKPKVKACMTAVNKYCETREIKKGKQGLTWPRKLANGRKYGVSKGYSVSCNRDRGTEYSKFNKVYNNMKKDRPSILLIHSDGKGVGNHYVVIEGAKKTQSKYLFKWHNRNVYYLINNGDGSTRKWICVRDWGKNSNKVYSSFSVYLININ